MIAIVNYQGGNLNNVLRAFENFGFSTRIIDEPAGLEDYSGVVLPGVGAFGDAMAQLRQKGFDRAIVRHIESGKPFLGICLGLQLLFEESSEFGTHRGLGIFRGRVVPFRIQEKVPHIGWNQVEFRKPSRIVRNLSDGDYLYFVHTYYVKPQDERIILTVTRYGVTFTSSIEQDNVFACQFHPEKSQTTGLKIIESFGETCAHYPRH